MRDLDGTVYEVTMNSADGTIYPGIARDAGTFGTPDRQIPRSSSFCPGMGQKPDVKNVKRAIVGKNVK